MKNPVLLSIAAGFLLATPFLSAEDTLPLNAVNRANEVIDAAIEAYGGAEAITNLNSVASKSHFTTWATNQSRAAGAALISMAARSSRARKAGRSVIVREPSHRLLNLISIRHPARISALLHHC